ncbi:putative ribonuclease H-like domain-containing protein [Tanacetum coccineum]
MSEPMPSIPTQSTFTYPNPNPSASPSFTQDDTSESFIPEPTQPIPTFTQTAFSQPAFSQPNQPIFSQPIFQQSQPTQTNQTGQQYPNNVQSQQFQQFQTASISANNAKFPYLEKDKYEIWAMKMEYWIQNADHNLWRIVQQWNSPKRLGKDAKGNTIIHPPVSFDEHVAVQRENKVRTLLLQALPEDHMLDFHHYDDARDIWMAVKARFGRNEESKKMRKTMLKQQFTEFSVTEEEGLHKGYDRFQKILSQLNQVQARPDNDDINLKFLRALPSSWSQVALALKTRGGLESMSFDDLYNKLRSLELDVRIGHSYGVKVAAAPTHSAFIGAASSGSKLNYSNQQSIVPPVSQTSGHQDMIYEDFDQVDQLEMEELDLKWQMAMLSLRINRFEKKAGRKMNYNNQQPARFDRRKVRCYKCLQLGHFARECNVKTVDDKARYSAFKVTEVKTDEPKALVSVDSMVNWSDHAAENKTGEVEKVYGMMAGLHADNGGADVSEAAAEFGMMGISPKVQNCPLGCDSKINDLNNMYNNLDRLYNDCYIKVQAYQNAVKTLESQKDWYHKTQIALEEKIRILSANLENTTNTLSYTEKLHDQAQKEKKEWEVKFEATLARFEKWKESSKNFEKNSSPPSLELICPPYKSNIEETQVMTSLQTQRPMHPVIQALKTQTKDFPPAVDIKTLPESDVEDPNSTAGSPSFSCLENVKSPRIFCNKSGMNNRNVCKNNSVRVKKCFVCGSKLHLIKDCDFYNCVDSVPCKSKAASVSAGSRNSPASVPAGRSDSAASRNRPAVNSAGRPNPAGWSKRPAPVSAGRQVSAGWLNPAARPYFRPSSVYFNNMYWPNLYDPMYMNKGRWGTAGDPSTDNDIENTTNTLSYTEKLHDQAQKEKKEWEVKFEATLARFEKWKESSKNLKNLIDSSMSTRTKVGLGFQEYFGVDEVFDLSTPSVFYSDPVEKEVKPLYSTFVKAGEMHAVPPPITGTYMPSPYQSDIEETQVSYGSKSDNNISDTISESNDFVSCDNSDKSSDSETHASCDSSLKTQTKDIPPAVDIQTLPESDVEDPNSTTGSPSFSCSENVKSPRIICNKSGVNNRKVCKNNFVRVKKCFVCGSKLHLIKDCDFYNCVDSVPCKSKAASVPAGSRNSSASVPADRSDPAASRNRPAVNPADRPHPAGWSKRPATVSAGRPVSAGWLNPAARPYFRPSSVYFNNMYLPDLYDPMYMNKGRRGTAGDPSTDNDIGIVDSGCSRSMTGNKEKLDDFVQIKGGIVKFGGGDGRISGKGTIRTSKLDFENVYYVEELQHFNLFSVSQICDKKNKVLFTDTDCLVLSEEFQLPDASQVVLRIPRKHDLYTFHISDLQPEQKVTCLVAKASLDESTRWHRRMAHVNFKTINKLAKEGLVDGLPLKSFLKAMVPSVLELQMQDYAETEILSQAEAKIRHQGVSADRDPAGGVSAGSTSAGSDPAGGHPAGPFQTAGSYDPAAMGDPAALGDPADQGDPAASTSVLLDFILYMLIASTTSPGKSLGSSENSTRFPVPSDVCKDQISSGIFTSSSYDDDFRATLTNVSTSVKVHPVPSKTGYISEITRTNHTDQLHCLSACFLSQLEPTSIAKALEDPDWVDAMARKMQQFINHKYGTLSLLPAANMKGTKWIFEKQEGSKRIVKWIKALNGLHQALEPEARDIVAALLLARGTPGFKPLLDYGFNLMNTKIFIDTQSTNAIVKNPVFHTDDQAN